MFLYIYREIKTLTNINEEKTFYASLIYNEDTKKITMEFSGFTTDLEAKSLCYLLMEQFGIENMNAQIGIPSQTVH
tara:strand:- start:264 stop:491 length:228 start_codon:yes stop_codon:yes gene_type:complete